MEQNVGLNKGDYYAEKVDAKMDRLWDEGKWSQAKIDQVLQEHLRTPYNG